MQPIQSIDLLNSLRRDYGCDSELVRQILRQNKGPLLCELLHFSLEGKANERGYIYYEGLWGELTEKLGCYLWKTSFQLQKKHWNFVRGPQN